MTTANPCGAFPIFQDNRLMPYNDFIQELNQIGQQPNTANGGNNIDEVAGNSAATANAPAGSATVAATAAAAAKQQFCMVQTKTKLYNEL